MGATGRQVHLAIIGLGAWGTSVLERTVARCRKCTTGVRLHVVEPGGPGGVYGLDQPDYLVLNVACGQISLYATADEAPEPPYALSLHEWAVKRGYSWVGHECRVGSVGRPIEPGDYLPRRLMGEYLAWFYEELVAFAPPNLEILRYVATATDVTAEAGGRERVVLDDGRSFSVDHVIITSGHTWNQEREVTSEGIACLRPYPVEYFTKLVPAGASVAIAGMGLVAFDLLAAMTIGRGGRFTPSGSRLRYRESGLEPEISLYSRSGMPYCAKSSQATDPTGSYEPVVCSPETFASLGRRTDGTRRQIDFRKHLQPLVFAEMQCRFYTHAAALRSGTEASSTVRRDLRDAWANGTFDSLISRLASVYGAFDPAAHVFAGADRQYASSQEYEAEVYSMVAVDLDHALAPGGSPIKAAEEVTRILRDQLRSLIEFGGLTLESYLDFQTLIRGRINRLEAGPPPERSQQLLALMDAGVVRIPFGPSPEAQPAPGGRASLRSTRLDRPHAATVDFVVRGHLDMPSLARSASPLLARLYAKGRLTQLCYGDTPVGSVAINDRFHPFDAEGRVQEHLFLLGVLTEGARYFTHYLPSPRSRLRAVLDAQACVEAVIA